MDPMNTRALNTCFLAAVLLAGAACSNSRPPADTVQATPPGKLVARTFDSGFALAHDTYNGISAASDGKIYYVLSSESHETAAQMYSYDPASGQIRLAGDLTEASGEKGLKAIAQGKSHVNFVESNGKLYFATHIGYYSIIDGMEKPGVPPAGLIQRPFPSNFPAS